MSIAKWRVDACEFRHPRIDFDHRREVIKIQVEREVSRRGRNMNQNRATGETNVAAAVSDQDALDQARNSNDRKN